MKVLLQGKKYKNGTSSILFGDLFNVYQKISNKVVGVLHRARKNRYILSMYKYMKYRKVKNGIKGTGEGFQKL